MAVTVYTGVMGSGKTYESIKNVLLPALLLGRRVVTNISGLDHDAIANYLLLHHSYDFDTSNLVSFHNEKLYETKFFYDPENDSPENPCFLRPGDLLIVDEAWQYWTDEADLSPYAMKYFRMHRHYVSPENGLTSDILILIQDLESLHKFIRNVTQFNAKFTKLSSLGFSTKYTVHMYEGKSRRKAALLSTSTNSYDKKIFPLYKSHETSGAKEKNIDSRVNLFNSGFFRIAIIMMILLVFGCGYFFWSDYKKMLSGGDPYSDSPASIDRVTSTKKETPLTSSEKVSSMVPGQQQNQQLNMNALEGISVMPDGRYIAWIRVQGQPKRIVVQSGVVDGIYTFVNYEGVRYEFAY